MTWPPSWPGPRRTSPRSRSSSSTTTPSTSRRPHHRAVRKAQAARPHLELHLARHHRLRHAQGHEGGRLPAADRGLRVRRSADPQEHQEGRHRRARARTSPRTATTSASPSTATSSSACPAKPRSRSATPSTSPSRWTCETIQVSIAHAYPGTEFYDYAKANGFITNAAP